MQIILASQSPRRRELLTQMGLPFTVRVADIDEQLQRDLPPAELVARISAEKAAAVAAEVNDPDALIIAADTVVTVDGTVLGKPRDEADAKRMLSLLSGRAHRVFTGFTLQQGARVVSHSEETEVHFRPLSDEEISAYIATGEPMDKAGAYGIQGRGSLLVRSLSGDYFNVMGLPVCALGQALKEFGVQCL